MKPSLYYLNDLSTHKLKLLPVMSETKVFKASSNTHSTAKAYNIKYPLEGFFF